MIDNIRLTQTEKLTLETKLSQINEVLLSLDLPPLTYSRLLHIVIERGLADIQVNATGGYYFD